MHTFILFNVHYLHKKAAHDFLIDHDSSRSISLSTNNCYVIWNGFIA